MYSCHPRVRSPHIFIFSLHTLNIFFPHVYTLRCNRRFLLLRHETLTNKNSTGDAIWMQIEIEVWNRLIRKTPSSSHETILNKSFDPRYFFFFFQVLIKDHWENINRPDQSIPLALFKLVNWPSVNVICPKWGKILLQPNLTDVYSVRAPLT